MEDQVAETLTVAGFIAHLEAERDRLDEAIRMLRAVCNVLDHRPVVAQTNVTVRKLRTG